MDILKTASRWPLYLGIAGLGIVLISMWYTNRLATQLSEIEKDRLRLTAGAFETIGQLDNLDQDVTLAFDLIETTETLPAILTDLSGNVVNSRNMWSEDTAYLERVLQEWINAGSIPIKIDTQLNYFGESTLLRQLRYFPLVLFFLITTFIVLGYIGLNQTRRAEQNRVWVGMAKETAHQLGTPISAIMGWVEHLKMMYEDNPDIVEVSDELRKDVNRLSMVANRFSKIGATPELTPINIYEELDQCKDYMEKRSPRKVTFDFPDKATGDIKVGINPLLFDWVIENLLRNALDAMDGKGQITANVSETSKEVFIDISDTGKGISAKNIRKVFNPGFTTKQRGWGLGLSLVKRIIVEYHKGRIQVARSEPGVGTTFTIALPKIK